MTLNLCKKIRKRGTWKKELCGICKYNKKCEEIK